MLSLEERRAEVADRTVPGHWEDDALFGPSLQLICNVNRAADHRLTAGGTSDESDFSVLRLKE